MGNGNSSTIAGDMVSLGCCPDELLVSMLNQDGHLTQFKVELLGLLDPLVGRMRGIFWEQEVTSPEINTMCFCHLRVT